MVAISEVHEVDEALVDAYRRLIPQLSSSSPPPDRDTLETIVGSEASTILIATDVDTGQILGSMTLALFRIPTGVRAWIEDVVVDADARGRGIGRLLNERALEIAAAAGARTVELTSRPSREAANRLYLRLGFEIRDTNVYRFSFDS